VKISVKELNEGTNAFPFEIETQRFEGILREVDDLYRAAGVACAADLYVDKVEDLLQLKGTVRAPLGFACARCLKDLDGALDLELRWTLLPKSHFEGSPEEQELTEDDLDVSFFEEDEIDLEALVREAILLELEPIPRCSIDDCPEARYLADAQSSALTNGLDPRWAPLAALKDKFSKE